MNLRSWSIYLLLAISIGFTVMTGFIIYYGEVEKTEDTRNLLKTQEVIRSANQLYMTLLDAETGQRGYLITGNKQYLEPYNNSTQHVQSRLDKLKERLKGGKEQQLVDNELEPAIESKLEELKQSIKLFNEDGGEAAIELTNTHAGRELMDQIRSSLDKIIAQEEQLLTERREELDQSYLLYNLITYGGIFFIGITIIMAIVTIRQQNRENEELVHQLEQSNDMLSVLHEREVKLSTEKSKFMSMAAHDLRSPLNAIISISELLKSEQDTLTEDQQEYLTYIFDSANKMADMINNFLDIEKIEDGKHDIARAEIVNVHNLLQAIVMGFQIKAEPKDISLTFDSNCEGASFCTDKAILSQVAENLISNAIKYPPSHTSVIISLAKSNSKDGFTLSVQDQGLGIKEAELEYIFDPYADISNEPTGDEASTGLGLSIVKNRMDTIGGTINCESKVGIGTTFTAHFPKLDCNKSTP